MVDVLNNWSKDINFAINSIDVIELQVSEASISSDVQYLRNQAKETNKEYLTERLPEQYQVCLSALDTIFKHAFALVYSDIT